MISLNQYVGAWATSPDWTMERGKNAIRLLAAMGPLEAALCALGVKFPQNPKTGSQISGELYGGFRPQACPIGAVHSSHKEGLAVDRYDPDGQIDKTLMAHQDLLVKCGIYIEHPDSTPGWSHWTIKAPSSGHHVFYP